jgi:cell division septal protein FtsQ
MARRRDDRAGWRRWLPAAVVLVLTAAVVVGVRWSRTSPLFRIERVETGRYRYTAPARLDSLLSTRLDANLWAADLDAFVRELETLPWVRAAVCSRRVPHTLEVRLWEWTPRLILAGDPPRALIEDGRLVAVPDHVPTPGVPGLVVDDGVQLDPVAVGELLAAAQACGLETVAPLDYVLCGAEGLSLALADGTRLILGTGGFEVRLQRYLGVADEVPPGASVDLRYQRQVFFEEMSANGG